MFTARQGQYLAFLHAWAQRHGQAPSVEEIARGLRVSPPSAQRMIDALHRRSLIARTPGQARSVRVLVPAEALPALPDGVSLPSGRRMGGTQRVGAPRRIWARDPHAGGVKIPSAVQRRARARVLAHAEGHFAGLYRRIEVRFRGAFCYVDAYREPQVSEGWAESRERLLATPTHLVRLRYFGDEEGWSLAFFKYSAETYAPCLFPSGGWYGTPEQAFEVGAVYLQG